MRQVGRFTFRIMDEADARAIQSWRYDSPYTVYNMDGEAEGGIAELLDRRSPHYAARAQDTAGGEGETDERGQLMGFVVCGTSAEVEGDGEPRVYGDDRVLSIGLGLRPDLTGKGLGLAFVSACLAFAREMFAPRAFRLFVLPFNERAMRVYERAGFQRVRTVRVRNIHGEHDFVEMRREA